MSRFEDIEAEIESAWLNGEISYQDACEEMEELEKYW